MSNLITTTTGLTVPNAPITTRLATLADLPFIDALQKQHSKQLGFFPRAQMQGYIANGWVLIAEESGQTAVGGGQECEDSAGPLSLSAPPTAHCPRPTPVGYCASRDRYQKRDELGAIFQLCVVPGRQRGLIGATLLKGVFDRAAWGCTLYCCWCAQDLAANRFWEAMGFVPLAFRTGSRTKGRDASGKQQPRVHIFWQKRIRQGDVTTPWWFPSETGGGSIREDRIVLPIPPGTHWSDAKPMVLPGMDFVEPVPALPGPKMKRAVRAKAKATESKAATRVVKMSVEPARSPTGRTRVGAGGLHFAPATQVTPPLTTAVLTTTPIATTEPMQTADERADEIIDSPANEAMAAESAPSRQPQKNDPRLIAAARELRDRWLAQVNEANLIGQAKYDVTRAIGPMVTIEPVKLLAA